MSQPICPWTRCSASGSPESSPAPPPPASISTSAPSARPSWTGCISGWRGSRRCSRCRPARDRWPETNARFRAERRRRTARLAGLTGLAAAASLAAVIGFGRMTQPVHATAEQLSQTMERSQALESALSQYNPEGRVLDGRTAGMAQELEDRIARVDRELEATELLPQEAPEDQLLKLWRERVGLLDALVDVHVTRASNAGL